MSNAVKRGLRTFFQGFLGAVITSGVLSAIGTDGIIDFAVIEKVGVSALAAGLIGVISYAQNALEDEGVLPKTLR